MGIIFEYLYKLPYDFATLVAAHFVKINLRGQHTRLAKLPIYPTTFPDSIMLYSSQSKSNLIAPPIVHNLRTHKKAFDRIDTYLNIRISTSPSATR